MVERERNRTGGGSEVSQHAFVLVISSKRGYIRFVHVRRLESKDIISRYRSFRVETVLKL